MQHRVISVLTVACVLAACGSEVAGTGGSGGASVGGQGGVAGGAAGGAGGGAAGGAEPVPCAPDFGDPVSLQPALDGQLVVLEGLAARAPNIVVVAPTACEDLGEGLNAALLVAAGQDVLLKDDVDAIACGCAIAEHVLCVDMPEAETIRAKGTLSYADNGLCNQVPCYEMVVSAICTPGP